MAVVRKKRPFAGGLANWRNRPFAALQDPPFELAESARKPTEPGRDSCANCSRSGA